MGLIRRENGYYYIRVWINGKLYKVSLRTKETYEAMELYSAWKKENYLKLIMDKDNSSPKTKSIEKAVKEYFDVVKSRNVSKGTLRLNERVKKILKELKLLRFAQINQESANRIVNWLNERYSDSYSDKLIKQFKAFLNYCAGQDYVDERTVKRLEFPRFKTGNRDLTITESDLELIFRSATDDDFKLYLKLLYYTASRPAEPNQIKKEDIDFENGMIRVYQPKVKKGKWAPIPRDFADEIRDYIAANRIKNHLLKGKTQVSEYYGRLFRELKQSLNLNPKYVLYCFRHTYATNALNQTGDIEFVSKQLGHSSVVITQKYYINRKKEDYRRIVSEMRI